MTISIGINLWGSVCYCQMKLWKNDPCNKVNPVFGWGGMLLWTNSGTVGCAASGGFGIRDWSRCWKQVQENIWRWHQPFYCILEEGCCSSVVLFSHPINFRKLWNCAPQVILFQKHPAKHTWRSIFFFLWTWFVYPSQRLWQDAFDAMSFHLIYLHLLNFVGKGSEV